MDNYSIQAKFKFLILCVAVSFIAVYVFTMSNVIPLKTNWDKYQNNVAKRQSLLMKIKSEFGYGGAIHHFKNYVLRGTPKHFNETNARQQRVIEAINEYQRIDGVSTEEIAALGIIQTVIDQYRAATSEAKSARQQGLAPSKIDRLVKINDSPALEAFAQLNRKYVDLTMANTTSINEKIDGLDTLLLIGSTLALIFLSFIVWLTGNSINQRLRRMNALLDDISHGQGNLSTHLEIEGKDELAHLATSFNRFLDTIHAIVCEVRKASDKLVSSAEEMTIVTERTIQGVEKQQSESAQTATAINQMSATVQEVAASAHTASEATQRADEETNIGNRIVLDSVIEIEALALEVEKASEVIAKLETKSDEIGSVLEVIKGIAEQTNLLALNAAIEAARAGEQGRGFAVVADEVRTLAQRTQDATLEIQRIIETLQSGIHDASATMSIGHSKAQTSVDIAKSAGNSLQVITNTINTITDMNAQIASATEEQTAVANEVNNSIHLIHNVTNQSLEDASKTMKLSKELKVLSHELNGLISQFKVLA